MKKKGGFGHPFLLFRYLYKKKGKFMFQLTWQEFSRKPYIAKLPLHEQVRQFNFEQQRHMMVMASLDGYGTGAGGLPPTDNDTINSFVEDDYINDYFE